MPRPLTSEGENIQQVWSPDGQRIAFARRDAGNAGLYVTAADGSGSPRRLTNGSLDMSGSWSRNGVLAFLRSGDVWTIDMNRDDAEPAPFRQTPTVERSPAFSPDGKWLAYLSNEAEADSFDVYVRPFPAGEPAHRITTGGAAQPVWSPDGRELFWTVDGQLWGVDVDPADPRFVRGQPRALPKHEPLNGSTPIGSIDISPDGRQFVGRTSLAVPPEPVTEIQMVLNWFEELKRLVPVK